MEILTEKEYIQYYEDYGRCIDETMTRKNPHRLATLKTKFKTYLKKQKVLDAKSRTETGEPVLFKQDEKWIELREKVFKRDKGCLLLKSIHPTEAYLLRKYSGGLHHIIDPAHVFGKGAFPFMKYDLDNVISLNRFSHSMLDSGKHPLTGKMLHKEQQRSWWIRIIGINKYEELEERSKRRNR